MDPGSSSRRNQNEQDSVGCGGDDSVNEPVGTEERLLGASSTDSQGYSLRRRIDGKSTGAVDPVCRILRMGTPVLDHVNCSQESSSICFCWDKGQEVMVQDRACGDDGVVAGVEHEGFIPEAVQQYTNPH